MDLLLGEVLYTGRGPRLDEEALGHLPDVLEEDLDRDRTAELPIQGQEHGPHAAPAELAEELIVLEDRRPGQGGWLRGYLKSMTIVALTVPDDLCAALHVPAEQLASESAFAAAIRLYEEGRVSVTAA